MGTSSQMKASHSGPQKKSFKVKVDEMNAAKPCKCKQQSMLVMPCQRGRADCLLKREVLYHAVSQKYCTSCSAPGRRNRVCRGRRGREHGHSVRVAGARGRSLLQGGSRAGIALAAGEDRGDGEYTLPGSYTTSCFSARRFNKPSIPGRVSPPKDLCDSFSPSSQQELNPPRFPPNYPNLRA